MFNTLAKAKLVKSVIKAKKNEQQLYKLVCAFNVYETAKQFNSTVYKFPVQKKCDFVSGDITLADLHNAINTAKKVLRTNNIALVS